MRRAIAGLALFGLAVSIYLAWVHLADVEPVCTGVSDCEKVQNSDYAELAGIPVAVIGIAGYAAILLSLLTRVELTVLLAYVAAGFSAYLTWAELFEIEAICQWCVASAVASAAIAVLATLLALRAPLHQRTLR